MRAGYGHEGCPSDARQNLPKRLGVVNDAMRVFLLWSVSSQAPSGLFGNLVMFSPSLRTANALGFRGMFGPPFGAPRNTIDRTAMFRS
jgi:hypothetical protein